MGRKFSSGDYSGKDPEWYWIGGLHDAMITDVDYIDLVYDYRQHKPFRTKMTLLINSKGALGDKTITSISFFNYKVKETKCALKNCFWMEDKLYFVNGKYMLKIIVSNDEFDRNVTITFDDAMVERAK